jgi:trehalose 6-phosphate phosphatase
MKNILSRQNRPLLEQFAWSNVLLAFDYDGTLAPIAEDPERAFMRPTTRELLQKISRRYPCIIISGRAQDDALRKLRGTGVYEVVGNHGLEPRHATSRLLDQVQRWLPVIEPAVEGHKGVVIENKLFSLAIHYRRSREKKKARAAILDAARLLEDVRIIGGKMVVNLLPAHAPHKGIALERERDRLGCDTAIYVGDDETDEDVFVLDQPGRLLTIRVGAKRGSMADYCIRDQSRIEDVLRVLLDVRAGNAVCYRAGA